MQLDKRTIPKVIRDVFAEKAFVMRVTARLSLTGM
jgi:hypothetical protein